ncbi:MAG: 5-formyltetrahydrofolate cyclo-ligase, partial [Fibrobacteres bacterium]|nr:5-formyltetrahydrofolate cyclo-ligase [Fibrobacterota bacterium]
VLIPGLCFDNRGGRLGKGLGFYDRYLAGNRALRAGLGFDVLITQKNLTLDPHDQLMDAVVSEKRLLVFSAPRADV